MVIQWQAANSTITGNWQCSLAEYVREMGYTHGTTSGDGASSGCFPGLSGDGILCTDQPLRNTGRFPVFYGLHA